MLYEALSDLAKAREIYEELLLTNPADYSTVKRLAALERDSGKTNEAINLLNKYLEAN